MNSLKINVLLLLRLYYVKGEWSSLQKKNSELVRLDVLQPCFMKKINKIEKKCKKKNPHHKTFHAKYNIICVLLEYQQLFY